MTEQAKLWLTKDDTGRRALVLWESEQPPSFDYDSKYWHHPFVHKSIALGNSDPLYSSIKPGEIRECMLMLIGESSVSGFTASEQESLDVMELLDYVRSLSLRFDTEGLAKKVHDRTPDLPNLARHKRELVEETTELLLGRLTEFPVGDHNVQRLLAFWNKNKPEWFDKANLLCEKRVQAALYRLVPPCDGVTK